jgi:hypothetical protein
MIPNAGITGMHPHTQPLLDDFQGWKYYLKAGLVIQPPHSTDSLSPTETEVGRGIHLSPPDFLVIDLIFFQLT